MPAARAPAKAQIADFHAPGFSRCAGGKRGHPALQPCCSGLEWLLKWEGQPIRLPRKFKSDPALIEAHAAAYR
jgi:hypothetical protein